MTEDLAYDLRQKYAEIVGVHLEAVSHARINKNYPAYFQALEDLFTVVKHKFKKKKAGDEDEIYEPTFVKDKKAEKKEKPKKETDLERFYKLRQNAIEKANKYPNVYFNRTQDPNEISELETAFREVEMFLFYVMDSSKMFGSTGYNEGM